MVMHVAIMTLAFVVLCRNKTTSIHEYQAIQQECLPIRHKFKQELNNVCMKRLGTCANSYGIVLTTAAES